MGCAVAPQQAASEPERAQSIVSKLSKKVSSKLNTRSVFSKKSSRRGAFVGEPEEPAGAAARQADGGAQGARVFAGAPLTLLESRFDPGSSCPSCGNTGLCLTGKFCPCPYGRKRPPAALRGDAVLRDVGPLPIGPGGNARMPRMKMGIRGPYVYELSGLHKAANPTWTHTYSSCAATGSSLAEVLEKVDADGPWSMAVVFIRAMPEILAAVRSTLNVDIAEESLQAAKADDCLRADGVVYTFSSSVGVDEFFGGLDTAGYDGVACGGAGLRALQLEMRASIGHDLRSVRVSLYQASSGSGFDGIVKLRRQIRGRAEPVDEKPAP